MLARLLITTGVAVWICAGTVSAVIAVVAIGDAVDRYRLRRELSDRHLARTLDTWAHQ